MARRKTKRDKKLRRAPIVRMAIAGIVVAVSVTGCLWYIAKDAASRHENIGVVEDIADIVEQVPEEAPSEAFDEHLLRQIDFAELQGINPDATRWMYVPGTALDSYVLQEKALGRYKYNLRNIYGRYDGAGCFLVPAPVRDESGNAVDDAHTLILGHRMNNYNGEWQFSNLPTRWGNAESAQSYPYVYLYHGDRAERWRVWAGVDAWASDPIYDIPYELGSDDYQSLLNHIGDIARYRIGDAPDKDVRTLVMSTCNRPTGGALMRFALVLVPDATYYYDTHVYVDESDAKAESAWKKSNSKAEDEAVERYEEERREASLTPLTPVEGVQGADVDE